MDISCIVDVLFLGLFLESELVRVSSIQVTMNLEMLMCQTSLICNVLFLGVFLESELVRVSSIQIL